MAGTVEAIHNYRRASLRLATSGQPTEAELAAIAAVGFEVVINLALHDDPRYSLADELGTDRALGLYRVLHEDWQEHEAFQLMRDLWKPDAVLANRGSETKGDNR